MILLVSLIILLFYSINNHLHSYWRRRNIFQMESSFLVGCMGKMFCSGKCGGDFFADIYAKFKSQRFVGAYMFYQPILVIMDPELIQDVSIKNFNSFHDRPFPIDAAKKYPLIGHLFSARGQTWRDLRVKLTPIFTSGKLKTVFPIIKNCCDVLLKYIEENLENSINIFDFRDLYARLTTDIISSVAFGIKNDSINESDNMMRKIGIKLFEPNLRNTTFNLLALLTPDLFVKLGIDPFGKEITDFMHSVVNQTVTYREQNNVERNDLMQLLIKLKNEGFITVDKSDKEELDDECILTKNNRNKLTMDEITANVFLFFAAGKF